MKKYILLLISSLIITTGIISCRQNRMKYSEKELKHKILTEEEQSAFEEKIRLNQEQKLADSLAKLPKGIRIPENRNIDSYNPPIVIDIAGNLNNIKEMKLSDVASDIKYVRMDPVPDPTLSQDMKYKYYMMNNYIVALNLYGIHLFSKEGKFIRTIVKNEMTGINYDLKEDKLTFRVDNTWIGGSTFVWGRGDKLYYLYGNNTTAQLCIMEYDCSDNLTLQNINWESENIKKIRGLGKIMIDLRHGKTISKRNVSSNYKGSWSTNLEGYFMRTGTFAPDRNTYIQPSGNKNMMLVRNSKGDTITTFRKLEQVTNYTKKVMRGTDDGTYYELNGNYYIRTDFNDTVFRVIPPNKLLPVYVLNLGRYKVSKQEGVDPGMSLQGKIIPEGWADTKKNIFLTFTKDNYSCPNTRKRKSVKIYHAVYFKKDRKLYIVDSDPTDYSAPILINDIDGGMPVWPQSYMIGSKGEILVSMKGYELKNIRKDKSVHNTATNPMMKEKLEKMINSVSDLDDILMIVQ